MIVINIPGLRAARLRGAEDGVAGCGRRMRSSSARRSTRARRCSTRTCASSNSAPTGTCHRRSPATNWCRGCGATRPTSRARAIEFVGADGRVAPRCHAGAARRRARRPAAPAAAAGAAQCAGRHQVRAAQQRQPSTCTTRRRRSCSTARGVISATAASACRSRWRWPVFVLQDVPGWTDERIRPAMARAGRRRCACPTRCAWSSPTELPSSGTVGHIS